MWRIIRARGPKAIAAFVIEVLTLLLVVVVTSCINYGLGEGFTTNSFLVLTGYIVMTFMSRLDNM